jgi:FAD:protein FMN transferase
MKNNCHIFTGLLFFILLSGCEQKPEEFNHSILSFGTIIDVTIYGVDEKLAEKAFADLSADFEYFHSAWTPYEDSSLSRINILIPTGKKFSIGPSIIPLYKESLTIAQTTDHLFNPAIGKLIKLWQFHKHDDPGIQPPDKNLIKELVSSNPRLTDLHLNGIKMHSDNTDVQLNFGAFAKGYAIDSSILHLKKMGIENAIINTGGDLKAIGKHGERPWNIGIRHPRKNSVLASIEIHGEESVFTSGDYQRFYMHKGKRYHHILNPRTGYPAQGSQSVTVIHNNSGFADAAATALFIAGPDHWFEMAKNLQLKQVLLIDKDGNIHLTPDMKKRLTFKNTNEATLIVSPPL